MSFRVSPKCLARLEWPDLIGHLRVLGPPAVPGFAAQQVPPIGPESAGMLMTPEEFDAIEDVDELYRYELLQGVLIVSPLPSPAESTPNDELGAGRTPPAPRIEG